MKYEGNLIIRTKANAKKYAGLTQVTGYLSIYSDAKLDAPKLESVGGDLSIYSDAKLDAPKLESVGGDLYIHSDAKLDAPKLESVGGYLYINSDAKLDAPKLYAKGFDNFRVYDRIACVVLSSKTKDGLEILSCRHAKIKQQKIIGERFYVARKDEYNAHGDTIQDALNELQFKLGDRNVEQYRNMPKHTRKTPQEWAFVYRMITGACQFGTRQFMESKGKLKKTYTLSEILEQTRGAYGHERFTSVVGAA